MINTSELYKMYQAWQQDNEHYAKDWVYFVEWVARMSNVSCDEVIRELQKYYWFKQE